MSRHVRTAFCILLALVCGFVMTMLYYGDYLSNRFQRKGTFEFLSERKNVLSEGKLDDSAFTDLFARSRAALPMDLATILHDRVRVLCWVMTSPSNLKKKATAVRGTWVKRCNIWLFISSEENKEFPTVKLNVQEGRDHLTAKTMGAFAYAWKHYRDKADWFLKADDDTYIIVENLRYLLAHHNPTTPIYFGHHFKTHVKQGYPSGGGAYVLSKEALRRLVEVGQKKNLCAKDHGAEDVNMGRCMEKVGVTFGKSADVSDRDSFHPFGPAAHINGGYPDWYRSYSKYGVKSGHDCCTEYSISFHYISPEWMYTLDYLLYHLTPFGITHRFKDTLIKTLFHSKNQSIFVESIAQLPTKLPPKLIEQDMKRTINESHITGSVVETKGGQPNKQAKTIKNIPSPKTQATVNKSSNSKKVNSR